ncbi:exodeoxyribonuclease III [Bacillus coahuilensis]|uniref:exodeoxyribonuclease III n=1 Tax=Bacillus coahuilensis TaxID=408580 RepID=UPI000AE3A9E2|nr:exodeoxyribonuclease III [Bacillus coahuilensis]
MRIVSWNVNGIRACVRKGFLNYFKDVDADIFCLQETKVQYGQIELDLPGYYQYWNYAEKKAIQVRLYLQKVSHRLHMEWMEEQNSEGRMITLEFSDFYVVTMYTPNSKRDLSRLEERLEWEDLVHGYLDKLNQKKPVIFCGDLNVAHTELDVKNDRANQGNSGFTQVEREKMNGLLDLGFTDTYRYFNPTRDDQFTWWSYMKGVRERNIGWRIDYFIVSTSLMNTISNSDIHDHVYGSDHCPIVLELSK